MSRIIVHEVKDMGRTWQVLVDVIVNEGTGTMVELPPMAISSSAHPRDTTKLFIQVLS